jgi:S1-C subfamily serine protease
MYMDLEQLTKTQITLLTLLVSFVTSLATGIATVSLMEQAPTDVTRVISRIVERPIETIIPGSAKTVVEERTVVISEGARIAEAVKKIEPCVVRLYLVSGKNDLEFKGVGIITGSDGTIVADSRIVLKRRDYIALLADGTRLPAKASEVQGEQGLFHVEATEEGMAFTPATFVPFDTLVLGQSVVAISGELATRIAPGVIAELLPSSETTVASRLRATVDVSGIVLGAPLIDLEGRVIGMPESNESQIFLSLQETEGE